MSKIVVLPRIEIDNPFGILALTLSEQVIPFVSQLAMNKEQIAILSDTELTDHIPVLKQFAPELLTQDGKIDWSKVEEYAKSDDLFKQQVANYLFETQRRRREFANLPIGAKLEKLQIYATKTNPQILRKEFMRHAVLNKYYEMINNANIPEDLKQLFLASAPELAERFVQNPAYFSAFLKVLAKYSEKQDNTKQEEAIQQSSSWRLSLDEQGQKGFGIRLDKPQLTPPQITPPRIPTTSKPSTTKRPPATPEQLPKQPPKQLTTTEQPAPQNNLPFDPNYRPREVGLIGAPDLIDLFSFGAGAGVGAVGTWLLSKFGLKGIPEVAKRTAGRTVEAVKGAVGKIVGVGTKKGTQEAGENVAKETAENITSKTATDQMSKSKYDIRREEVGKRISQQMQLYKEQLKRREELFKDLLEFQKQTGKTQQELNLLRKMKESEIFSEQTKNLAKDLEEIKKRAQNLRNMLELYKQFQKQTEDIMKELKKARLEKLFEDYKNFQGSTIQLEQELKKYALDPKKAELLKKAIKLRQELDKIEKQMREEYQNFIRKLRERNIKHLKIQNIYPIKPGQKETILKAHRKMPPTEQLIREEILISSLRPLQTKAERLQELDKIVLQLLKTPQSSKPSTQTIKKQTKKKSTTKKKKSNN